MSQATAARPIESTARAGGRGGEPEAFDNTAILGQGRSQRADIGIACRSRIDRLHREGGTVQRPAGIAVQRTFAPQRDQRAAHALRQQTPRRSTADRWRRSARPPLSRSARSTSISGRSAGVRRRAGAGLSTTNHPAARACADRMRVRLLRYLMLQQQNARRACTGQRTIHQRRVAGSVGARDDHDRVATQRIDGDQRGAGRPLHRPHGIAEHAIALQPREKVASELIISDTARHRDARAKPRRRNRLICPLSAGRGEELRSEHGLPGARQDARIVRQGRCSGCRSPGSASWSA